MVNFFTRLSFFTSWRFANLVLVSNFWNSGFIFTWNWFWFSPVLNLVLVFTSFEFGSVSIGLRRRTNWQFYFGLVLIRNGLEVCQFDAVHFPILRIWRLILTRDFKLVGNLPIQLSLVSNFENFTTHFDWELVRNLSLWLWFLILKNQRPFFSLFD